MILSIEDLKIQYRTDRGITQAVDGATFGVPEGQAVGLVGESGCGKTTVARAINGVMAKNASIVGGKVIFDGQDVTAASPAEREPLLWRRIAFIPQSAMNSLDPVYRVEKQIEEILIDRGGYDKNRSRARAVELFEMVGLDAKRLRDYPHQFSGGMRQRAAIALALALNPTLVIADEPVTALDVIVQRQVLDTFRDLQSRLKISVILVTHDISVVAYTCDQVVVMYAGVAVESGPTGQVLTKPFHPYTMGLYHAFPDLHSSRGELTPIEGSPPDLMFPPKGCPFAERCPFALDKCHAERPPLEDAGGNHYAACWRISDAVELRRQAGEVSTWQRS